MNPSHPVLTFLLLLAAFVTCISEAAVSTRPDDARAAAGFGTRPEPFLRGMTVSCPRSGQIWGTQAMADTLKELKSLGVTWVALHPYAWVGTNGAIRFRPAAEEAYLERAVAMARSEGIELFWKPHLGYWGSFGWRGEIQFGEDEQAWKRFFEGYQAFIVDQARFAARHGLTLFAVGVELEATTHRETEWRAVVAAVRAVYPGRILYAANWDRLERVPFWDAVDLLGVQAYFPLSDADDPSEADLRRGWAQRLAPVKALARQRHLPILFTEIGYNRSPAAAREPWAYQVVDSRQNRELRRRLLEVSIAVAEEEPQVAGLFWWKWMPGAFAGRSNFSMRDPEAIAALRSRWVPPATAAGTP
jgi:hypothetical protein